MKSLTLKTAEQIQDRINHGRGMEFVRYRAYEDAKSAADHAIALGFGASCDWSPCYNGIDVGAWHVCIWNRACA